MNQLVLMANVFAARAAKRAELVTAAVVMMIVFMLVLPLPTGLLDVLIAVNLCAAGLIVVVSMYMPGPTAFSSFPTVLLLTALFRLAIEVSITRKILLEADAGDIVETFGNFVLGGNMVVGLVVFAILTVVQFLVITKGSERVSEVTARFTLDAMPGKQMSIDSDLRAGLLRPEDAKRKRAELAKESQLHGAMDGAMKFVKGDAIAGIFIVVVNLIGGFAIGVLQNGMDASSAMRVYSVLSIGDALIAQIPALLISLAAGMITTRVVDQNDDGSSEETGTLGQQIVQELFGEPKALITAGAIMLLFALVPGMPTLVFLSLALLLGAAGAAGLMLPRAKAALTKQMEEQAGPVMVDARNFNSATALRVLMPTAMQGTPEATEIETAIRQMRSNFIQMRGIPDLPLMKFIYNDQCPEGRLEFQLAEVPLVAAAIKLGWGAVQAAPERLAELGLEADVEQLAGGRRRRTWVKLSDEAKLTEAGFAWERWEHVFASDVEYELLRNCASVLGVQESQRFVEWAEQYCPELAKEFVRSVPAMRLTEIVQRLARESVSLRNVRLLLESIHDWAQKERDPDLLADYVRLALRRQVCHDVSRQGMIQAILLSPELEDTLRNAVRRNSHGPFLQIGQDLENHLLDQISRFDHVWAGQQQAPVLVTTSDIRRPLRLLLEEDFFPLRVLAYSELTAPYQVQPVGMLEA